MSKTHSYGEMMYFLLICIAGILESVIIDSNTTEYIEKKIIFK